MSVSEFEARLSLARSGAPFDSDDLRQQLLTLLTSSPSSPSSSPSSTSDITNITKTLNPNHTHIQLADVLLSAALPTYTLSTASHNSANHTKHDEESKTSTNGTSASHSSPSHSSSSSTSAPARSAYFAQSLGARVEAAVAAFKRGEFVVVIDGAERENEGDLILAAEKATPEKVAFMVNETSGMICCGMEESRLTELKLPQMVIHNTDSHKTAYTVSCDYNVGTTTGISAHDRCATLRALSDPQTGADRFNRPGHMFPLRARPGGVLERDGHTESAVDLCKLAGLFPAGALCEIVRKDGLMMRPGELYDYAARHRLAVLTVEDLIAYRKSKAA